MSDEVRYVEVDTQDDEAPVKAGLIRKALRELAEGK